MDETPAQRVLRYSRAAARDTERRDAAIVEMREAGASLREIAALAGMTHVGIRKILARIGAPTAA